MAVPTLDAIGFCAHYSKQGDWAFHYALRLSRQHLIRLNIFHFLSDPYRPSNDITEELSEEAKVKIAIESEKELRMYYDERAGDYLDVGFRLCEDAEWVELHRCLVVREFQILVLGYIGISTTFGNRPIVEFAHAFVCPVILVGPDRPDQYHLNNQAALLVNKLGLENSNWETINLEFQ